VIKHYKSDVMTGASVLWSGIAQTGDQTNLGSVGLA